MAKYDFRVEAYEIDPPLENNIGWGAKAHVKEVGTGRSDDSVVLHEHWGSTVGVRAFQRTPRRAPSEGS